MKDKKGFTLVELLAVIVILAIIMIIAIPSVLQIMNTSNKKNFENYVTRINNETQKVFAEENLNGTHTENKIYNIQRELGLSSTGDFKGYSLITPNSNKVYMTLYNNQFAFVAKEYNKDNVSNEIELINNVSAEKLTPEYLCSVVEEFTECIYITVDEEGNETINTITPTNHEYDTIALKASSIRTEMAKLVPLENITKIKYSREIPEEGKLVISTETSKYPLYIWANDTVIYYGTEAPNIFLNSNSENLFKDFSNLEELDTIKIRTDEITKAAYMFYGCSQLKNLDISNWNLSKLQYSNYMFYKCKSLEYLDITNWKLQSITTINNMFNDCNNLKGTIDLSTSSFTNLTDMGGTFFNCFKLEVVKLPNTSNVVTSLAGTFTECRELKIIENIENFNATNVTRMDGTFKLCYKLESLDLSRWRNTKVTNISWCFQSCNKLKTIDLSGFTFERCTTMAGIACNCENLETIIFNENKNFGVLTSLSLAFGNCPKLKEVNLSGANFTSLISLSETFIGCHELVKVDLSNINAPALTNFGRTFAYDESLEVINLTGFIAPNVENMYQTFCICKVLKELDLRGIGSSHLTNINQTFQQAYDLKTIYTTSDWDTELITNKTNTFTHCNVLSGGINYNASKTSGDYAKIVGGYFTYKG